jgi:hypothetical protein
MRTRPRLRSVVLATAAVAVLGAVFMLYLQPNLALTLATQLWNCF